MSERVFMMLPHECCFDTVRVFRKPPYGCLLRLAQNECAQSLLRLTVPVALVSSFASVHWCSVHTLRVSLQFERNRISSFSPSSQISQVDCDHLGGFLVCALEVVKVAQISCAWCSLLFGWSPFICNGRRSEFGQTK